MNNTKIETLFSDTLEANETKSFRYKVSEENTYLKGLLQTNHTAVSISFINQEDLEIEGFERSLTDALELPPAKRILHWEQDLTKCTYVSGTIKNLLPNENTVNIYVYLER